MIEKVYTYCDFIGDNFYPTETEKNLNIFFDEKNNPNEFLQDTKLYVDYGTATLIYEGDDYPSDEYLNRVSLVCKRSKDFSIDNIVLYMNIRHDGQCNLEFKPDFLKKIADMNIVFAISTYHYN